MKKLTTIVVVTVTAALIIFDIFVGMRGGSEATISGRIWDWSLQWPEIPFAFGFLMGHFFFRW